MGFLRKNATQRLALFLMSVCCGSAATAQQKTEPPTLTLQKAMRQAQERAFVVQMAQAQLDEAQARAAQALGALFPRIDADAQQLIWDSKVNKATGQSWAPQFPKRVTTAALQVSQPIVGFFPLSLMARASSMMADVAALNSEQAKRDAALLGAQAFLTAVRTQQFLKIAESSLALVEKQKNDSEALYRAGKLSQADVMRFELSVADSRAQLTQAGVANELALLSLSETLQDSNAGQQLESPGESFFEIRKLTPPPLAEVLKSAFAKRPELKAAQNQLSIANLTTWAARLDYAPSLNGFARYERDFEISDLKTRATDTPANFVLAKKNDVQNKFSFGLQLKWNIWDWGTRWNKISEVVAQRTKAEINAQQAESLLKTEVIKSYLDLRSTADLLQSSISSVRLAEEVYRLTQARFTNAQASPTDLISAERDQARARGGLVNARAEVDLAWFRLQRNMGLEPTP